MKAGGPPPSQDGPQDGLGDPGRARAQVAAIEPAGRDRVLVRFADGTRAAVPRAACDALGVSPGGTVELRALEAEARAEEATAAGLRLLALRDRSRSDLERRLARRFPPGAVARAMERLAAHVDDAALARRRVAQELARRPSGRPALVARLLNEGVSASVAREAVADVDEPAQAARAAARILPRLRGLPPEVAARRLGAALGRLGFGGDAIRGVMRREFGEDGWERSHP